MLPFSQFPVLDSSAIDDADLIPIVHLADAAEGSYVTTVANTRNNFFNRFYPAQPGEVNPVNMFYPFGHVNRYGAIGDGSANDTVAIQTAVNNVNTSAQYNTVTFYPGWVYKTTAAINLGITGNIIIQGNGARLVPVTAGQRGVTGGGPISNILIDALHIINTGFATGYIFVPVTNLEIKNCRISGANASDPSAPGITAGVYVGIATNVRITNCDFDNNGYTSALPQTVGGDIVCGGNNGVGDVQVGVYLFNNRCKSTTCLYNIGIFDASYSTVEMCDCSGALIDAASNQRGGYGVMFYNTTSNIGACHHNKVIGCTIKDTQGTGIYFQASHNSIAENNSITNVAKLQSDVALSVGGISVASSNACVVEGNIIMDVGKSGVTVSDTFGACYGVVVDANIIDGVTGTSPGIYIRGYVKDLIVSNNSVINCHTASAAIGTIDNGTSLPIVRNIKIIGNVVKGRFTRAQGQVSCAAGTATFTVSQAGQIVDGNKIRLRDKAYLVSAFNGTTSCTLQELPALTVPTFAAADFILTKSTGSAAGIIISAGVLCEVDSNDVDNVGGHGIVLNNGSGGGTGSDNRITNNRVTDASATATNFFGIYCTNARSWIDGNYSGSGLLGSAWGGFNLSGTGITIGSNLTPGNSNNRYTLSNGASFKDGAFPVKEYGAVGDNVNDDTTAIQACIDACETSNGTFIGKGFVELGVGQFKISNKLRIKIGRLRIKGAGKQESRIRYEGVAAGCIVADNINNCIVDFSDFSINGDTSSGAGIDFSAISNPATQQVYNSSIRDMEIFAGTEAIVGQCVFSTAFSNLFLNSVNAHATRVNCGPGVSWRNCYAGTCGAAKAGYRLTGTVRMYGCNGINSGGYWGVFGSQIAGVDGFQGDFAIQSYPDVVLDGCNIEAWTISGLYVCSGYQQLKVVGGATVRNSAANYHSTIHTVAGPRTANQASVILEGHIAFISGGGVPTSGFDLYADNTDYFTLADDSTGFTQFRVNSAGTTYPVIKRSPVYDTTVGGAQAAQRFSAVKAGRVTADKLLIAGSGAAAIGFSGALVAGTKTFNTTQINASSFVTVSRRTAGGTTGELTWTKVNGTSITVNSSSALDTSTVDVIILESN